MIEAVLWLFKSVLDLLIFVIFASVIMSWLVAFNVVNPRNQVVWQIDRALRAITDPLLMPIRRIIPPLGGLDISPMVLVLLLSFLERLVANYEYGSPFAF